MSPLTPMPPPSPAALSPDLADLAAQHPKWEFGEQWSTAATGPDVRTVWARRGSVILKAREPAGLGGQVWVAERMPK